MQGKNPCLDNTAWLNISTQGSEKKSHQVFMTPIDQRMAIKESTNSSWYYLQWATICFHLLFLCLGSLKPVSMLFPSTTLLSCVWEVVINSSQRTLEVFELGMNSYPRAVHFLRINFSKLYATLKRIQSTIPTLTGAKPLTWITKRACKCEFCEPSCVVDFRKMFLQLCNGLINLRVALTKNVQWFERCRNHSAHVA